MFSMTYARLAFCAAVVCLMLAACGGGGGGSAMPSEAEKSQELRTLVQGMLDRSDTLLATEQHVFEVGQSPNYAIFGRIRTNCRGGTCAGVVGNEAVRLSDLEPDDEIQPITERGGIQLAAGSSVDREQGVTAHQYSFGGWLDHNGFFLLTTNFYRGAPDPANFTGLLAGAASFGDDSGSRPISGAATWNGAMVGVQEHTFQGFHGDATVTVDFETAKAGVAFTGIENMLSGDPHPSMTWSGLDIGADGRFTGPALTRGVHTPGSEGHSIVGTFYGPNHEEVGGVFERNSIAGAFGASRK